MLFPVERNTGIFDVSEHFDDEHELMVCAEYFGSDLNLFCLPVNIVLHEIVHCFEIRFIFTKNI